MLLSVLNTKGGEGKTLWATSLASYLEAELLDLNPENGDAHSWAASRGLSSRLVYPDTVQQALEEARESGGTFVADCPPWDGVETRAALLFSRAVLLPVGTSTTSLRGLGRMVGLLEEARAANPGLRVGVLGTGARPVAWTKTWTTTLQEVHAPKKGVHFLGIMPLRQPFEDAYGVGLPGYLAPAPTGREVASLLDKFISLL